MIQAGVFIALVLGTTLAAVLVPIVAVWILAADLFISLWRHLWKCV